MALSKVVVEKRTITPGTCTVGPPQCEDVTGCTPSDVTDFPGGCLGADGILPPFSLPGTLQMTSFGFPDPNCAWVNTTIPLVRGTVAHATDDTFGVYLFDGRTVGAAADAVAKTGCTGTAFTPEPAWYNLVLPFNTLILLEVLPGRSECMSFSVRDYFNSAGCGFVYSGGGGTSNRQVHSVNPFLMGPFPVGFIGVPCLPGGNVVITE